MLLKPNHFRPGLSLVETMIFIAIVSVVFVTIISSMVGTSRIAKSDFHRLYATRYADDAIEWLRFSASRGWQTFYNKIPSQSTETEYCMNINLGLADEFEIGDSAIIRPITLGSACEYRGMVMASANPPLPTVGPKIFRRTVKFTTTSVTEPVKVTVTVSWQDSTKSPSVASTTILSP
jgi:type II secretory pathway pseudopilin PulG